MHCSKQHYYYHHYYYCILYVLKPTYTIFLNSEMLKSFLMFTLGYSIFKKNDISFTGMTSSLAEPFWQSWITISICSGRISRGGIKKNTPKDLEIGVLSL